MKEVIFLLSGAIILVITIYDFFYTTLSGSGESFITRFISKISNLIVQRSIILIGRKVISVSGMLTNLLMLGTWIVLVWVGLFLLFSSSPDCIVDTSGRPASSVERLYYTGYTLSTLGMGDFKPVTPFSQLLTSIFSFYGFVFFTTSMTYLLSLSSALIHKRTIALSIQNLGDTPKKIANNLLESENYFAFQRVSSLQLMLDRHYISHQAYPVLHYFGNAERESSFSLNLAILDEAVSFILYTSAEKATQIHLFSLRLSITHFLSKMQQKYGGASNNSPVVTTKLPYYDEDRFDYKESLTLEDRRKIMGRMLKNEGFKWDDVFRER